MYNLCSVALSIPPRIQAFALDTAVAVSQQTVILYQGKKIMLNIVGTFSVLGSMNLVEIKILYF